MSEPHLLIIEREPELYLDLIESRCADLRFELCREAEQIPACIARVQPDIVLSNKVKGMSMALQEAIYASDSVKWVHVCGAGTEHLPRWDPARITVTNSSGALSIYMAEFVITSILAVNFGIPGYLQQMRDKQWQPNEWISVRGRTLLIVGLGRIGKDVAKLARAIGMRTAGINAGGTRVSEVDEQFPLKRLHEALAQADFVAVHAPLTDRTRGLFNAEALACMKPTAWLINSARGAVMDQAALTRALAGKAIAGAVLDVFEKEPLPRDSPLWNLDNVVVTPHVGDLVGGWQRPMVEIFCDNFAAWCAGKPLVNVVDPQRGY